MTPAHKLLLGGIRKRINELSADIKTAHDAGYLVNFGINNATGEVTLDIKQLVPIDLDQSSH